MKKHTKLHASPHLPFQQWMEQAYPADTATRNFLQLIGVLDLHYVLYRLGIAKLEEGITHEIAPIRRAMKATATIKSPAIKPMEKVIKKRVRRVHKVQKTQKTQGKQEEITIEFHKDLPTVKQSIEPEVHLEPIEPEPLILNDQVNNKPVESEPESAIETKAIGKRVWLNDPQLEGEDLKKTSVEWGINGIGVSFEKNGFDDEAETLLKVNNASYRLTLISPPINVSKMLQIARVDNGELYILGRAALGALSGEGYVTADEAARIVHVLHRENKTTDIDVTYFNKNLSSRNRISEEIAIRFERVN